MTQERKQATRKVWLDTLARHRKGYEGPDSEAYWASEVDAASRDEIIAIQNDKLAALSPFLYENSEFYRRRFDRLGLAPSDIRSIDDLPQWPVVDKQEMVEDALANPPYGNLLANEDVPKAMYGAFNADEGRHLADRLVLALEAALEAGGEAGPVRSAGLMVVHEHVWPLVDLRVDWDDAPISALRHLWQEYEPQMDAYVTRALDPTAAPAFGVPGDP